MLSARLVMTGATGCAYVFCSIARKRQHVVGALIHYALFGRCVARAGRNELWPLHWLVVSRDSMQKSYAHLVQLATADLAHTILRNYSLRISSSSSPAR